MRNKVLFLMVLLLISSYGCTKQVKNLTAIKVDHCSYTDELFDYCKKENIKFYEESIVNLPVNFNTKYILVPVNYGEKKSYSGMVAIEKKTGHVDTMQFGFKNLKKSDQIVSDINSDIFCINGEINSKSLSITRSGKNCFKFNHNGFSLVGTKEKVSTKDIYPIFFDKGSFKCGSNKCNFINLNNNNLKNISRGESNTSLKFLVNEKGFDSSYIDASDEKNILYVIRYSEGDNSIDSLSLSYFYQGEFKTKNFGVIKSLRILDSRNIELNGKKIILN